MYRFVNIKNSNMKKILILLFIAASFCACSKEKPEIKKPGPVAYGDPRLAVDSNRLHN